ncbi:hypothetical protein [Mesorhizobium sp.]|uniref:hypothetical protein n=1 Tax=Mesorhizobium sp. TaxID=1871066 RepID=UPI0025BA2B80|nr:hypothetical protein [Mesorhizobium sp.]
MSDELGISEIRNIFLASQDGLGKFVLILFTCGEVAAGGSHGSVFETQGSISGGKEAWR